VQDKSTLNRRSFLELLAGAAISGVLSSCGPAHKIGEELGLCCDHDNKGPYPKPGALVISAASREFSETRLIDKINSQEKVYEPDADLLGFVNTLFQQVHSAPIPSHLTYEFGDTMAGGALGRYIDGHVIIAPGLPMDVCIHTMLHEIGHNWDTVTWAETPAEFEAVRDTLESLVLHPKLNKETDYALLKYSHKWSNMWGRYGPDVNYGSVAYLCALALIKNNGNLALAQNDLNFFFLSPVDAKRLYQDNHVGRDISSQYFMDELKDMAMASWFGAHEQEIFAENKNSLLNAAKSRETEHVQNIVLPPGIVVPVNYSEYLSRSVTQQ